MTTCGTSQAVSEWVRLFPSQVAESYTSSVLFMKQLTVVAISTITYLKNVFPEDSYITENFGGTKVKVLKKKCKDDLAQFVSTGLVQSFEAFEKKYLDKLVLCFYDTECKVENLMEYHIFEFVYAPDGVSLNLHSKLRDSQTHTTKYTFEKIREKTMHLIRACVVVLEACQNRMPDSCDISLRLYYNDDAPEGYQAPGFLPGDEFQEHFEPTLDDSMHLGSVHTPYHSLTLRTYIKESVDSSHEVIPSENVPVMSLNEQDDFETSSAQRSIADDIQIVCQCKKSDNDPTHDLIICEYCGTVQHAACYGVRRGCARAAPHCCAPCHDADRARAPTDARLAALPAARRESLCIFRRTLEWLSAAAAVRTRDLMDKFVISSVNAAKLMKLLQAHGVVAPGPDTDFTSPRPIIHENLKEDMNQYFQNEGINIVDRLIEETLSQNSQADPVGDVLAPMEKVNLQKSATVCKVTLQPLPKRITEDATLKQYREAILSNEVVEDGLPLSGSHNPIDVENKAHVKRKVKSGKKTGVRPKKPKNK